MSLILEIREAFSSRRMPSVLIQDHVKISPQERAEAMKFLGRPANDLTSEFLQQNFEFIYWLTPEAFTYYLPGILCAGVKDSKPDLIINDSLVEMLARSPDRNLIDDFFWERWGLLTLDECNAFQSWLLWLSDQKAGMYDEHKLSAAFDMIEWLKRKENG